MPLLKQLLYQMEKLMQRFVPEVCSELQEKEVPYEVFSIQWYLSIFSCDFDSANLIKLWDLFLMLRWKFLLQLSIAILRRMCVKVKELAYDKLVVYLKSALSRNQIPRVFWV